MSIRDLFLWMGRLSPVRYEAMRCKHRTKLVGTVSALGRTTTTKMKLNSGGSVDYCLDCIGRMSIRCAWCGNPIFIGDPITLYTPEGNFRVSDWMVTYSKKPLQLVGCLGLDCADTGADRAGFWVPGEDGNGQVKRVPTAYEAFLGPT